MKEKEIRVSVIVPVYNAESNLRECLDSIVGQTLSDIEIICVDDGSTDGSLDILNEYRERDSRFIILTQQNLFAGVARNNGMKKASGKYLAFWDADDYFRPDALEKMYLQCESDGADICVCSGKQFLDDLKIEVPAPAYLAEEHLPGEIPFNIRSHPDYFFNFTCEAPWNKLYRRSFIEAQGLEFQARRNVNDAYFVVMALSLADRITIVREELVVYRKNQQDNLVSTVSKANLSPFEAWSDIRDALTERGLLQRRSFDNKALNIVVYHLHYTRSYPAFRDSFEYLKREGLSRLGVEPQEGDYYFQPWKKECLDHILNDTVDDFLAFFAYRTYIQLYSSDARRYKLTREKQEQRALIADLRKQLVILHRPFGSERYIIKRLFEKLFKKGNSK